MPTILYYYDSQGTPNYSRIYTNFMQMKNNLINMAENKKNAEQFCSTINGLNLNLSDIAQKAAERLAQIRLGPQGITYEQAMKDLTSTVETTNAMPNSVKTIIGLRSGLFEDGVYSVNNNKSILNGTLEWEKFLSLNLTQQLQVIGEDFSSLAGESLSYEIIKALGKDLSELYGLNISYTNTGEQRVIGFGGNTVQRMTDNILNISYLDDKTGKKVSFSFNISDKYGKNFLEKSSSGPTKGQQKSSHINLRTSTVKSITDSIGLKRYDVLNTLSFHRKSAKFGKQLGYRGYFKTKKMIHKDRIRGDKGNGEDSVVMMASFNLLKQLLGIGLILSSTEETRILAKNRQKINDRISFMVIGTRIVPYNDVIATITDRIKNSDSVSLTSIEGISEEKMEKFVQEEFSKGLTNDARTAVENYLLSRRATLSFSI